MSFRKAVCFLFLLVPHLALAAGDLMLFPTRLVFEKNRKSAQVDLTNTGNEPASYRITLENKRMTEFGEFILAPKALPGELFADQIVQYSPRQVELPPGSGQTIRIILRKPADLSPGEYRTHLVFSRLPDAKKKSIDPSEKTSGNEIGVTLTALIGVSIPVIIQVGETNVTGSLTNLKVLKPKPNDPQVLELRIERAGTKSLYGDLLVSFVPKSGSEQELAHIKGIAVYSPNPSRLVKIALQTADPQKALANGKINVKFSEARDAGGKLIAEASLEIK